MKKILLIVVFLFILVAIPITVYLTKQRQEIRQKAAATTSLYFEPSSTTAVVGEEFELNVKADTGQNQVAGIELHVSFSALYLEAISIRAGDFTPSVLIRGEPAAGSASIAVGPQPGKNNFVQGTGTVAVVRFKALAPTNNTATAINIDDTKTNVSAYDDQRRNVLQGTQSAQVTITAAGGSPVPTPQASGSPGASATPGSTPRPSPSTQASATPAASAGANTILIQNATGNGFNPKNLTIRVNETVTWRNNDTVAHTVTSDTNLWNSGTIAVDGTYSRTFTTVGTFPYHCEIHPNMTGTITVTAGTGGGTASPTPTPVASASTNPSGTTTTKVTAPANNATVTTSRPTISGTSFPNALIIVTIPTSPAISSTFYANATGAWSFTPNIDIENGTYQITVSGQPTNGNTETITSTFTVNKAGTGGTTTASATPRTSSIAVASTAASSATGSSVPVTGATTPTFFLLGFAILMLMIGTIATLTTKS